jgi:predicted DNA-binding transcriptional regulator YafY
LIVHYFPGERIIEPHAVGYGREGQLLLRAYQVEGASESGEPVHWKLFRLDRCEALEIEDATFDGPREGYRRGDSAMKRGVLEEL